jgi:hypothetical protein
MKPAYCCTCGDAVDAAMHIEYQQLTAQLQLLDRHLEAVPCHPLRHALSWW